MEIDPRLPEPHCVRARYLEEEGRAEEAEKQVRTALNLDPGSWEANREAARMLYRNGHTRDAIPFLEKAASLVENDWSSSMLLVSCYAAAGDEPRKRKAAQMTIERAERLIAQDPTNGSALAGGATSLVALGEKERARDWMRRALLLDPDNLNSRYNIACTLSLEVGDANEAIDVLVPYFERVNAASRIRHAESDPDLDSIRDDPRFKEMLAAAKKRLGI